MSNTAFPGAIDSFYDPASTDTLATTPHHLLHGQVNDAVNAIETKLGTGSSSQTATIGAFLIGTGPGASNWNASPTSPSFTTGINDTNGKTWIGQTATASAVNYANLTNSVTGAAPAYGVGGTDTNINLNLVPKGSGKVQDNGTNLIDFRSSFVNFVSSGGIWSQTSGLVGAMTAATIFIAGVEYSVIAVASHTFAASSDTYIDYTVGTGLVYTAVANNAASPSLAANSVRLAIVVTGGAAISSVNQGSTTVTAPVASSSVYAVSDSLGNLIYPTNPNPGLLGYRYITTSATQTSSSPTFVTGMGVPIIASGNRKLRITAYASLFGNSSTTQSFLYVYSAAALGTLTTQIGQSEASSAYSQSVALVTYANPAAGFVAYNLALSANSGTVTLTASSTIPAWISVEEV